MTFWVHVHDAILIHNAVIWNYFLTCDTMHMHTHSYQIVSENGTHIFATFQISNLTSLAKIDPAKIVTADQAVDYITSNMVGSQLPFQIQISPNVSVTPSLRVAGRGPAPTACNDSFCDCSVPLVDPDGTCSTPNCATPPDIPSYFSVTVQQIDQHTRPPSAQTYKVSRI